MNGPTAIYPPADAMLEAVADYLRGSSGEVRSTYLDRIAGHIVDMTRRELAHGEAAGEAERQALAVLLGKDGSLAGLNREFAATLRSGGLRGREAEVLAMQRAAVRAALEICNPRWLDRR